MNSAFGLNKLWNEKWGNKRNWGSNMIRLIQSKILFLCIQINDYRSKSSWNSWDPDNSQQCARDHIPKKALSSKWKSVYWKTFLACMYGWFAD